MPHTKSSKEPVKKATHREKSSDTLLESPPLTIGIITDELFANRELAAPRDPTDFDFQFTESLQPVAGLFQGLAMVFPESHSFELFNGSKWSTSNIEMVKGWVENTQLLVSQNQTFFSTHRFSLLNTRLGKAAPITLLREPRPTGKDVFYITKLDLANDVIVLNGFQEWAVYPHDHGTLRKLSEHDRIMVGVNTSDYALEKPMRYILIDTATNLFVRANPLTF